MTEKPELRYVFLENSGKFGWRWVMKTRYGHWVSDQDVCDKSVWSDAEVQTSISTQDVEKCWRHDYKHREYVCTCVPPREGDTGR